MAVKMAEVEARSKSNTHRIDELTGEIDAVNRLATAVQVMATEQQHTTKAIEDIKEDVKTLDEKVGGIESKPAKRWENMVEKIISGIVGGLVTALVGALIYLLGVAP